MHVQMDFDSFGLDERLTRSLRDSRILAPTTVQRASIPALLEGRDLAMQAGSGTGRVLAFCLPVMHRILGAREGGGEARAVVVTAGTEASMRVHADLKRAARHAAISVLIPAAGVELTPASYSRFDPAGEKPDVLVGLAPAVDHFLRGTGYPSGSISIFVVHAASRMSAAEMDALRAIAGRLPASCQRVAVSPRGEDLEAVMDLGLLRSPAMVMDSGGASRQGMAPEAAPPEADPEAPARAAAQAPAQATAPVDGGVLGPRRSRSLSRRPPTDKPETWPIAHVGVTVPGNPLDEDVAMVARVEARGHTVVIAGDAGRAAAIGSALSGMSPSIPVTVLGPGDPVPGNGGDSITVATIEDRSREDLTANVLVLERFPSTPGRYVAFIPMMRCDPGDRMVSMVQPRDVGTTYQLRLAHGIRLLERRVPTRAELGSMEQADMASRCREAALAASRSDMDLLARVRTMDAADEVLAAALGRMLSERGAPAAAGGGPAAPPGQPPRAREAGQPRQRQREARPAEQGRAPKQARAPRPRSQDPGGEEPLIKSEPARQLERGAGRRGGTPMVEIELSAGKAHGVEADYLVQFLQSRLAMPISDLGPIKVLEDRTIVTVSVDRVDEASMMLGGLAFGDRRVEVKVQRGRDGTRP